MPDALFPKSSSTKRPSAFDGTADTSAVTEHIKNIRAKLRACGLQPIETVWGIGYRWKKRVKRSRTLHGLLLGYLLRTGAGLRCRGGALVRGDPGRDRDRVRAARLQRLRAALRAMEILPEMSAEHF